MGLSRFRGPPLNRWLPFGFPLKLSKQVSFKNRRTHKMETLGCKAGESASKNNVHHVVLLWPYGSIEANKSGLNSLSLALAFPCLLGLAWLGLAWLCFALLCFACLLACPKPTFNLLVSTLFWFQKMHLLSPGLQVSFRHSALCRNQPGPEALKPRSHRAQVCRTAVLLPAEGSLGQL